MKLFVSLIFLLAISAVFVNSDKHKNRILKKLFSKYTSKLNNEKVRQCGYEVIIPYATHTRTTISFNTH